MKVIDFLIGVYGFNADFESQVERFLLNLRKMCKLDGVKVVCVERSCLPVSSALRKKIGDIGFGLRSCPLLPFGSCREDASQFSDWMVKNVGSAAWVGVSHFDIVFKGDYFDHVKTLMPDADMIGNHHDGIVFFRRDSYNKCQVGFSGVDGIKIVAAGEDIRIFPANSPVAKAGRSVISLDVGELLALRMHTLGLRHVWIKQSVNDIGKSELFVHTRRGSGHSGGGTDCDNLDRANEVKIFFTCERCGKKVEEFSPEMLKWLQHFSAEAIDWLQHFCPTCMPINLRTTR